jgi:hypothetical protein
MIKTLRITWTENGVKKFTRIKEDRFEQYVMSAVIRADNGVVSYEDEDTALMADVMAAEAKVMPPRVRDLNALCRERLELRWELKRGKISQVAYDEEDKRLAGLIKQFHLDNSRIMPK